MLVSLLAMLAGAPTPASAQETKVEFQDNSPSCTYRKKGCRSPPSPEKRRSDDMTQYGEIREFLFPETGVDPMRKKYEELFGEPYPPSGNSQFAPSTPFAEVRKFNKAFDRVAAAGARTEVQAKSGVLTVSVRVPDSQAKALKVFVNDDRILLSLEASAPPGGWRIARRQEFSIPNPPGIDPSTVKVARREDLVEISFLKLVRAGAAGR